MAVLESLALSVRLCETPSCGRSLEGMSPRARFCCESHRQGAADKRKGRPRGRVAVGSDRPCCVCRRPPGEVAFGPCGPGMRDLRCVGCRAVYMRAYMRKRNGTQVKRAACPQCGGDVHGRQLKFCGAACRSAWKNARLAEAARLARTPRECPVCKGSFTGPPNRKACKGKCSSRLSLVRRYGLTYPEYEAMLASQGGCCAACGLPFGDEVPRIDHCHETDRVRGLLHNTCNAGIGQAHNDPEKLLGWATYLCRDTFDLRDFCVR